MSRKLIYLEETFSGMMLVNLMMMVLITLMQFDVKHSVNYVGLLWIPIYAVAIYVVNCYMSSIFVAFPALIACAFIVMPFSESKTELAFDFVVAIIMFIIAVYSRSVDDGLTLIRMPIEALILYIPMYLYAKQYDIGHIPEAVLICSLIYLLCGLIEIYLANLIKYLDNTRGSTEIALKSLVKTDNFVFMCFIGMIVVGLLILFFFPAGAINAIKGFIISIVNRVIKFILFLITLTGKIEFKNVNVNFEDLVKDAKPLIPSEFWIVPELILKVVILAASIRILYLFIRGVVLHLMKYRGLEYDDVTFKKPDAHVRKAANVKTKREDKLNRYNLRHNVRLKFIKLVREHDYTLKHLHKSATPKGIVGTMELEEANDYGKVTDYSDICAVYEKARYSNEPITREDITTMRRS